MAKVSDLNLFRTNPKFPKSFRNMDSNQTDSFRSDPKNVINPARFKTVENKSDLIRFTLIQSELRLTLIVFTILINPIKQIEKLVWIRVD